ncbi:HAD family hydrolase [Streptomyces sp. O3]
MTSDAMNPTGRVAKVTEDVSELIARARSVLFDFDGPVCRLFAGHRAHAVADSLLAWLAEHRLLDLLTEEERRGDDPHIVLRAVGRHPDAALVAALEDRLTEEELYAAPTALPTPYADRLIQTWRATGVGLAVASNNSPRVVDRYLRSRGLLDCFTGGVHGRTSHPRLLKPDPDCLHRALATLGTPPSEALMIGDTPTDLLAAREAGVAFLGYGRDDFREKRLRAAGARHVVGSLDLVLDMVWKNARP